MQVTPEASSTSSGLGLQGSGLQDGNLGLQENNITKDDEALEYEPAAATGNTQFGLLHIFQLWRMSDIEVVDLCPGMRLRCR
jgi:hypothetical protein